MLFWGRMLLQWVQTPLLATKDVLETLVVIVVPVGPGVERVGKQKTEMWLYSTQIDGSGPTLHGGRKRVFFLVCHRIMLKTGFECGIQMDITHTHTLGFLTWNTENAWLQHHSEEGVSLDSVTCPHLFASLLCIPRRAVGEGLVHTQGAQVDDSVDKEPFSNHTIVLLKWSKADFYRWEWGVQQGAKDCLVGRAAVASTQTYVTQAHAFAHSLMHSHRAFLLSYLFYIRVPLKVCIYYKGLKTTAPLVSNLTTFRDVVSSLETFTVAQNWNSESLSCTPKMS